MTSLWEYGAVSFTCIVVISNAKLLLNQYTWTRFHASVLALSVGSWFAMWWGIFALAGREAGAALDAVWGLGFFGPRPDLLGYAEVAGGFVIDVLWCRLKSEIGYQTA